MELSGLIHPDDLAADAEGIRQLMSAEVSRLAAETRVLDAADEVVWISLSTSLVRGADGEPLYRVAHLEDLTERKRFEGQLQYLADHDSLTGLFNRRRFESELGRELSAARRHGTGAPVLALDLDNFKYINDALGHSAGDELIACVARAMKARLRESDILGRLGGDEFAVILPHADEDAARVVAATLLDTIRDDGWISTGRGYRHMTASVGSRSSSTRPIARAPRSCS